MPLTRGKTVCNLSRMTTDRITTIRALIDALGGAVVVAELRGVTPEAVRLWWHRGSIGGDHRVALLQAAESRGLSVDLRMFERPRWSRRKTPQPDRG